MQLFLLGILIFKLYVNEDRIAIYLTETLPLVSSLAFCISSSQLYYSLFMPHALVTAQRNDYS